MNHLTHDTYAQALIANLTVARTENDYTTIARIAEEFRMCFGIDTLPC